MSSSDLALYGTEEAPAPSRTLTAGGFSFLLERGQVREFCRNGVELIRGIAFVIRSGGWDTPALQLEDLEVGTVADRVSVRYRGTVASGDATLDISAGIDLDRGGHLRFAGVAKARGDFETNRAGFVVLYPLRTAAGAPLAVEHTDGTVGQTQLPRLVSPGQPALDIRSLRHEPLPGVMLTCRFEGDVFEMEDHRNWTDASFKVYSRPLAWPRPYVIASGSEVRQAVDVTVAGRSRVPVVAVDDSTVRMSVGEATGRIPGFGIAARPQDDGLPAAALARYTALPLHHLLCEVGRTVGRDAVAHHARLLRRLAFTGELALEAVVSGTAPEEDINRLAAEIRRAGLHVAALSVFMQPYLRSYQPTDAWPETVGFDRLYAAARRAFPEARVGGGSYAFFTELNRQREAARGTDFVTHTTAALVHDCDDRSVMQTLESLPDVFATVRAFAGDVARRVGPVALGLRHNPGGGVVPNLDRRRMVLTDDDPRWHGRFGASWMLGFAAEAAKGGIETVVFGALGGPFALVSVGHGAAAGTAFPVFHAFSTVAAASGHQYVPLGFDRPDVRGFGWLLDGRRRALVANNGPSRVTLICDTEWADVSPIPADAASPERRRTSTNSIELGPYDAALLHA
jgi:D-apionolactonase